MRKLIFVGIFVLAVYIPVLAQSWAYSNAIMGTEDISVITSTTDNNNNVTILGYFTGTIAVDTPYETTSHGGRDIFALKFDPEGNVIWIKTFGGSLNEDARGGITTDLDDNVYISAAFQDWLKYTPNDSIESTGSFDMFLTKIMPDGSIDWLRIIGTGSNYQRCTSIEFDNYGDLILAGYYKDSINILNDTTLYSENLFNHYFYSKFNSTNGDLKWVRVIKPINNVIGGRIFDIQTNEDSYFFTGNFTDSIDFSFDTIVSEKNSTDVHLFKTDTAGNIDWLRRIRGEETEYSYTISIDPNENVYIAGYYNSPSLKVDSSSSSFVSVNDFRGGLDYYIAKYSADGILDWVRTNGGISTDKLIHSAFYDNQIHVSGYFSDTINWGGIKLATLGVSDRDMFVGSLDPNGNYRNANSYSGRNSSEEDARSIFSDGESLYTVIRSNSDLLVLGDDIYTSTTGKFYVALGIIGCSPISIDQVIIQDVQTCYGDSTGSIQILASGGFGAPWQYSIDNGLSYQDLAYYGDLPAGEYPIVVVDSENCTQPGSTESVSQPDTLIIELVSSSDITLESDGEIVVAASGGTAPYTYTLQPGGVIQGFGTYTFAPGDSGLYIVEVNDAQSCGPVAIDTIEIKDLTSVGIDGFSYGEYKMYPNPSSGVITLEMPFDAAEASIEVLSLTGQVMFSRQVYSSGGMINETIDLTDLSKGMYMIRVDGQTLKSGVVLN